MVSQGEVQFTLALATIPLNASIICYSYNPGPKYVDLFNSSVTFSGENSHEFSAQGGVTDGENKSVLPGTYWWYVKNLDNGQADLVKFKQDYVNDAVSYSKAIYTHIGNGGHMQVKAYYEIGCSSSSEYSSGAAENASNFKVVTLQVTPTQISLTQGGTYSSFTASYYPAGGCRVPIISSNGSIVVLKEVCNFNQNDYQYSVLGCDCGTATIYLPYAVDGVSCQKTVTVTVGQTETPFTPPPEFKGTLGQQDLSPVYEFVGKYVNLPKVSSFARDNPNGNNVFMAQGGVVLDNGMRIPRPGKYHWDVTNLECSGLIGTFSSNDVFVGSGNYSHITTYNHPAHGNWMNASVLYWLGDQGGTPQAGNSSCFAVVSVDIIPSSIVLKREQDTNGVIGEYFANVSVIHYPDASDIRTEASGLLTNLLPTLDNTTNFWVIQVSADSANVRRFHVGADHQGSTVFHDSYYFGGLVSSNSADVSTSDQLIQHEITHLTQVHPLGAGENISGISGELDLANTGDDCEFSRGALIKYNNDADNPSDNADYLVSPIPGENDLKNVTQIDLFTKMHGGSLVLRRWNNKVQVWDSENKDTIKIGNSSDTYAWPIDNSGNYGPTLLPPKWVEGYNSSSTFRDTGLELLYNSSSGQLFLLDNVAITVIDLDIDADTNNDNAGFYPDFSVAEERAEDNGGLILPVNNQDANNDGNADCINDVIDCASSINDMAKIYLKMLPRNFDNEGTLTLTIDCGNMIRLFREFDNSTSWFLGGNASETKTLSSSNFDNNGNLELFGEGVVAGNTSITLRFAQKAHPNTIEDVIKVQVVRAFIGANDSTTVPQTLCKNCERAFKCNVENPPADGTISYNWSQKKLTGGTGSVVIGNSAAVSTVISGENTSSMSNDVELECGYNWNNGTRIMRPFIPLTVVELMNLTVVEFGHDNNAVIAGSAATGTIIVQDNSSDGKAKVIINIDILPITSDKSDFRFRITPGSSQSSPDEGAFGAAPIVITLDNTSSEYLIESGHNCNGSTSLDNNEISRRITVKIIPHSSGPTLVLRDVQSKYYGIDNTDTFDTPADNAIVIYTDSNKGFVLFMLRDADPALTYNWYIMPANESYVLTSGALSFGDNFMHQYSNIDVGAYVLLSNCSTGNTCPRKIPFVVINIDLDVDTNMDGDINNDDPSEMDNKALIIYVNNDNDGGGGVFMDCLNNNIIDGDDDYNNDMERLMIRKTSLPRGYTLTLTTNDNNILRIFDISNSGIIGPPLNDGGPNASSANIMDSLESADVEYRVECVNYGDAIISLILYDNSLNEIWRDDIKVECNVDRFINWNQPRPGFIVARSYVGFENSNMTGLLGIKANLTGNEPTISWDPSPPRTREVSYYVNISADNSCGVWLQTGTKTTLNSSTVTVSSSRYAEFASNYIGWLDKTDNTGYYRIDVGSWSLGDYRIEVTNSATGLSEAFYNNQQFASWTDYVFANENFVKSQILAEPKHSIARIPGKNNNRAFISGSCYKNASGWNAMNITAGALHIWMVDSRGEVTMYSTVGNHVICKGRNVQWLTGQSFEMWDDRKN
jgi:hypothetical protein